MKAYLKYFKLNLMTGLQYRVAAYAGVATQFFWGFMYLMIYAAFYQNHDNGMDFNFKSLVSYLWLQQAFLAFVMTWFRDQELFDLITKGNLAYELCRPLDLYRFWYAKLLAKRLSAGLLRCVPILLVAFILPEPYKMVLPPTWASAALFILTLSSGLLVVVALSMFVYLLTMKTMSGTGAMLLFGIVGDFLSGSVIPLPLMPSNVRAIVECLPFRYAADFPFRIYSGHIGLKDGLYGLCFQWLWLVILIGLGSFWMRHQLKRVSIQGG